MNYGTFQRFRKFAWILFVPLEIVVNKNKGISKNKNTSFFCCEQIHSLNFRVKNVDSQKNWKESVLSLFIIHTRYQ
jgi:hypothetical protein